MTCKDCIHYDVCKLQNNKIEIPYNLDGIETKIYVTYKEIANIEKFCEYFKDKSTTLDLPCKVGDTVYAMRERYTECTVYGKIYDDYDCRGCREKCDSKKEHYIVKIKTYLYWIVSNLERFGKTVFLTKEQAEKALEGLKNE